VVYGLVLVAFVLFEPMGLYGRWLKVRTWFQLFPFYRRGMFKRQKSFHQVGAPEMSAAPLLSAKDLSGALRRRARGQQGELRRPQGRGVHADRAQRRRQDDGLQPDQPHLQPDRRSIEFEGHRLTDTPPHRIAELGIARTFQNIELFEYATVLQNLLIGHHVHRKTGFWNSWCSPPPRVAPRPRHAKTAEEVIDFLDLQHHRESLVAGLPYGVRKVVELARALCTRPKLLLLDEPSSGLNVEETDDMAFWIAGHPSTSSASPC
jgi:hypothetical protein